MTNQRFLEIARDKEICELCEDLGTDIVCINCKKVKPITREELVAFWNTVKNLRKKYNIATAALCELCKELAHERNNICGCYSCAFRDKSDRGEING